MDSPANTPADADERLALVAAVAEARADSRPDVPDEIVRAEIKRDLAACKQRLG